MLRVPITRPGPTQLAAGARLTSNLNTRFHAQLHLPTRSRQIAVHLGRQRSKMGGGGMLHDAVKDWDQKKADNTARSYSLPTATPASSNDFLPPPFKTQSTVLQSVSANSQRYNKNRVIPSHGVKRTSNGLIKATSGSFEDDEVQITGVRVKNTAAKPAPQYEINENDFDSDIDLDVEELSAPVTYPKLPSQSKASAPPDTKPITYPTLPTQSQQHFTKHIAASCATEDDQPFDWSSSPSEHKEPRFQPFDLKRETKQTSVQHVKDAAAPSGPRKLPWESAKEDTMSTPAARAKDALWNTSTSAIKDQQKKHRGEKEAQKFKQPQMDSELVQKMKSNDKRPAKVFLSEEQAHVCNLVVENKHSVFFTGSAGTGKSVLLRQIIADLRVKYKKDTDRVAVTASTGLAACNIGGVTLHSFAGIGLGKEDIPELIKKIRRNQKAKQRWLRTQVLVIDEVSMVDGELFDKLEQIARTLRNNGRPFGGIQLVITGDFFQLPPVPDKNSIARFCFDAASWSTTIQHTICLHQVFRQKDPVFAQMLNEMREGRLTPESIAKFKSLSRNLKFEDNLRPTNLFPLRNEVDKANNRELLNLQGVEHVFEARDGGSIQDKVQRDRLLNNCIAPEIITLKKGAQVMLIKNVDELLVNGSIGEVMAFQSEAELDSRAKDDTLYLQGADEEDEAFNNISKEDKARRRLMENVTTARRYPLVRFHVPDGTTRDLLCQPESWKVELPNGEIQASRSQVPLILSWALSIHKAQGQTLERVKVDLARVFEKGQAYVALSRATSMEGLQVLNFNATKVMAHERVGEFYSNLARYESTMAKKEAGKGKSL